MTTPAYLALAAPAATETEIRRSRFLGVLQPARDEEQAREAIATIRSEHPRARHHCTAFVIGPQQRLQRSNDDGEPSGTAGAPMLEALLAAGLSDVVAVVVRYFGGVLLGAGGLTRAYRAAVADTVAVARLVTRTERTLLGLEADYAVAATIEHEAQRRGWSHEATYGARVTLHLGVPTGEVDDARARLAVLTSGGARVTVLGTAWVDLPARGVRADPGGP